MDETWVPSAVQYLVDGGEYDAANLLLACEVQWWETDTWWQGNELIYGIRLELAGPRAVYEVISQEDHPLRQAIMSALGGVMDSRYYIKDVTTRVSRISIDPGWREELLEIVRGRGVHNQAADHSVAKTWRNLRFRSEAEVRIAQALDEAGVLFFPNCKGRASTPSGRQNREPDFLICYGGRWGILEVDGEPFHPPTRTVEDHERDRIFKGHGIKLVEHYDATRCYQDPKDVVASFLELLRRS